MGAPQRQIPRTRSGRGVVLGEGVFEAPDLAVGKAEELRSFPSGDGALDEALEPADATGFLGTQQDVPLHGDEGFVTRAARPGGPAGPPERVPRGPGPSGRGVTKSRSR